MAKRKLAEGLVAEQSSAQGNDKTIAKKRKVEESTAEKKTGRKEVKSEGAEVKRTSPRTKRVKVEVEVEEEEEEEDEKEAVSSPARKRKVKQKVDVETSGTTGEQKTDIKEEITEEERKITAKRKTKPKDETVVQEDGEDKPVAKRKRKTKEEKEADMVPLAARTVGHKLFIGAHVSAAGGVQNAILNSTHIGANAFALFLKSQRKWANPDLAADQCTAFHDQCSTHTYDQGKHVVPHGSYLVNLAHTDPARTTQAYTSYLDDLQRCERLGIKLYNIHPGNTVSNDRKAAIAHLAKNLNAAHRETSSVITLLENMAAGGNVLGSTFQDLADIIALIDDKSRIGVCLDTCHAFAAGYDLRTPDAWTATMDEFDQTVGLSYLRALHMNDSKAPLGGKRDLHANIGTGFLGLRAFWNVVNSPHVVGLPLVLETPITVRDAEGNVVKDEKGKEKEDKNIWAEEIKLLERLVGMDTKGEEFLTLEEKLAKKGRGERERVDAQVGKRKEKEEKASSPKKKHKKKNAEEDEEK